MKETEYNNTPSVYAARSTDDEIRSQSSSGGVFTELARQTIESGGVVFGSRFDEELNVVCDYTDTIEGLAPFRGSKYVAGRIGNAYKDAQAVLSSGRQVLFSGTPCQIAGLRKFLKRDYDNLLTLEVVCHGVPSLEVWRKYLDSIMPSPSRVNFRTKPRGWKNYHVAIDSSSTPFYHNRYMHVFLSDMALRESCYNCRVKNGASGADLTLGDFWGIENIHPEIDDDRGLSLVIVRTRKGAEAIGNAKMKLHEEEYEEALRFNPSIEKTAARPAYREMFMRTLSHGGFDKAYELVFSSSLMSRLRRRLWFELNKRR